MPYEYPPGQPPIVYTHPFMDLAATPLPTDLTDEQRRQIDELFAWTGEQAKFPSYSREHAHQFLHACLWDTRAARKAMQKYSSIRAGSPSLFDKRDTLSHEIQLIMDVTEMVALPKRTPDGYKVLIYRLHDFEPSHLQFADALKAFCMFNDYRISCDGLTDGYIVVFDMKGIRLGHVSRVQLGVMRAFMAYIQEAHPVRLKRIHVVHTAAFINQVMTLVRPFIRTELFELLKFTANGPDEVLDAALLPSDYGGQLDSMRNMYETQRCEMELQYRPWLIDSERLSERRKDAKKPAADPAPRPANVEHLPTSFGKLEID